MRPRLAFVILLAAALDLPLGAGGALRLDVPPDTPNGETKVAPARNGLYISRDSGAHWQQAASGLPEVPVQDIALVGSIFLASMQTGGLYISHDRGRTWARIEGTLAEGFFPGVCSLGHRGALRGGIGRRGSAIAAEEPGPMTISRFGVNLTRQHRPACQASHGMQEA